LKRITTWLDALLTSVVVAAYPERGKHRTSLT
jgi:hypothetical protein